ncbi:MAG: magnesium protoporphyrin IX methyltransferase [Pseudomonadota bacterium]
MAEVSYEIRRGQLQTYFDQKAKENWVALTSNTPVSRIRETVRQGREEMRNAILNRLPEDLSGKTILDAGCGTGMLAIELAERGADVLAIDISPKLIEEAQDRYQNTENVTGSVSFKSGDMSDPSLGSFDYVVAMDSLIHYPLGSVIPILEDLSTRTHNAILFTFAPFTPMLAIIKAVGKLFPKNDKSPAIMPIRQTRLEQAIQSSECDPLGFKVRDTHFVSTAFYKSQVMELSK